MKKWHKVILFLFGLILVFGIGAINSLDTTPIEQLDSYTRTTARLDSLANSQYEDLGDTLQIGWAKVNLTPSYKTSLAGYGKSSYSTVKDSAWVRAFVFDNGNQKVGMLSPDLLIFPPEVKNKIELQLANIGLDAVVYSATHTHHSVGNWHRGTAGRMFAGPFNEEIVQWIATKCIKALEIAKHERLPAKIGHAAVNGEDLVYNRLVGNKGKIDPWIRFLLMKQDRGETAILTTFSAHATTISRDSSQLHRDYPGLLVDQLEDLNEIDFAAFAAGAVASQGPGGNDDDKANSIAKSAVDQISLIINMLVPHYTKSLLYLSLPIDMREPQLRVSEELTLRPWLFDQLFGDYSASINGLKIGENLVIGTPCDFSGELIQPIDSVARALNLNLMLTSFNGEYIGYITEDAHYELNKYEIRTMNWFGPENGKYFSDMITGLIKIFGSV